MKRTSPISDRLKTSILGITDSWVSPKNLFIPVPRKTGGFIVVLVQPEQKTGPAKLVLGVVGHGFRTENIGIILFFRVVIILPAMAGQLVVQKFFNGIPCLPGGDADPLQLAVLAKIHINIRHPCAQLNPIPLNGHAFGNGGEDMFEGLFGKGFEKIGRQSQIVEQDAGGPVDAVGRNQSFGRKINYSPRKEGWGLGLTRLAWLTMKLPAETTCSF